MNNKKAKFKMKVELTSEEIGIINDLLYNRVLELNKFKDNEFIDNKQIESYIDKIQIIWNKLIDNK